MVHLAKAKKAENIRVLSGRLVTFEKVGWMSYQEVGWIIYCLNIFPSAKSNFLTMFVVSIIFFTRQ